MGGGGSQAEYNNVNIDKSGLDEFSQTQKGQTWGPWIQKIKQQQIMSHYDNPNSFVIQDKSSKTGFEDISNVLSDYNQWLSAQAATNKQYAQYKDLAQDQQGRDATILTGPASQKTLLGR